jgi:RNA polymerase sigma-70 factor, ECF subfamily
VPVKDPSPTTELIHQWQAGHEREQIFQTLFERYVRQIYRFFQRKGFSPTDCHDLTQETFFSVYKGLNELRQPELFENWLFRVAMNVFRTRLEQAQAQKRQSTVVSLDDEPDADQGFSSLAARIPDRRPTPLQASLEQEKLSRLREAMNELPEQMRRCAQLRFAHELSYQEIANVLGISIGTVKAHLNQARQRLRQQLRGYFNELDWE